MKNRMVYWAYKLAYPRAKLFLRATYPMYWIMHFIPPMKESCEREMKRAKYGIPIIEYNYGIKFTATAFSASLCLIMAGLLSRFSGLIFIYAYAVCPLITLIPAYDLAVRIYYGTDSDSYIKMIAKESRKQHIIWALISFGVPVILFCIGFYMLWGDIAESQ